MTRLLNINANILGAQKKGSGIQNQLTLSTNSETSELHTLYTDQSASVNWGDGTTTIGTTHTHTYSNEGTYNVRVAYDDIETVTSLTLLNGSWSFNWSALEKLIALQRFDARGTNTINGTLALASTMTHFFCSGMNTLAGNNALPSGMVSFICEGFNTLSLVIDLPNSLQTLVVEGLNRIDTYTSLNNTIKYLRIVQANNVGLSSAEIDSLLADLNTSVTSANRAGYLYLKQSNAPRTATSDIDVTALEAANWAIDVHDKDIAPIGTAIIGTDFKLS